VLTARRATVIRRLALMNPSALAQIIPATRQKQNAGPAKLVREDGVPLGGHNNRCLFFEWAATNYPGVTYTEANGVRHMVDFVRAHHDTFNRSGPVSALAPKSKIGTRTWPWPKWLSIPACRSIR
jgi:hypothetical protein